MQTFPPLIGRGLQSPYVREYRQCELDQFCQFCGLQRPESSRVGRFLGVRPAAADSRDTRAVGALVRVGTPDPIRGGAGEKRFQRLRKIGRRPGYMWMKGRRAEEGNQADPAAVRRPRHNLKQE
jgi:hypothetical protein